METAIFLPCHPDGLLGEAVESMFYLGGYTPEHNRERLMPDGHVALIIELDGKDRRVYDPESLEAVMTCKNAWFSGMHSNYLFFDVPDNTELMAVRFKPGWAYPLLGGTMESWSNRIVPAREAFGPKIDALRPQLIKASTPQAKLSILESWLRERFDDSALPDPHVRAVITSLEKEPTISTIHDLMESTPMSRKHFIALFRRYVGVSPKIFQRILRFAEVMPLIQQKKEINWTELAIDCGYYDQSHFIKDFRRFSGYNPQEFVREDHDRINFLPAHD